VKRVLVIRNDRIGDLMLATPLLDALKTRGDFVGVLASPYAAPLLETDRAVDALILDQPGAAREIQRLGFDTALLLWGTWRNAWLAWRLNIPNRVGASGRPFSMLLSQRIPLRRSQGLKSESDYNLDFFGSPAPAVSAAPRLHLDAQASQAALNWLKSKGLENPVMLHPGSGGSAQNWEPERYAEFGVELKRRYAVSLLVTAGPQEMGLASQVASACGAVALDQALPLRVFAALCGQASLFVSASTGPMHLAAALGAPTLSLFPPLRAMGPRRWAPRGNPRAVLTPAGLGQRAPEAGINYVNGIPLQAAVDAAAFLLKDFSNA
jgi:heptosyltransferase-2